jgi:hypothetical protein
MVKKRETNEVPPLRPREQRRMWRARIHILGAKPAETVVGYFQSRRSATAALDGAVRVAKALGHTENIGTEALQEHGLPDFAARRQFSLDDIRDAWSGITRARGSWTNTDETWEELTERLVAVNMARKHR